MAQSGVIGEIRDVEASFSRLTASGLREMTDARYGGAFTEFGSYTLLPIVKLPGREYRDIRFDSILNSNGIDGYTKTSFIFDGDGLALSKTGVSTKTEGQLLIVVTKGYILVKSPWWLTQSFEVRFEDPNEKEVYASKFLGKGLRYEISDFVRSISGDKNKAYKLTRGESIAMGEIMERFLEMREENKWVLQKIYG